MFVTKDLTVDMDKGVIRYIGVVVASFVEEQGRMPFECVVWDDNFYCESVDDMLTQVCKYLNANIE